MPYSIAQAIAHRRNLQRGQRIDEAGRKPTQSAVAQAGVRLRFDDFLPVLPRIRLQVVADEFLDSQIDDVVDQRAADQELHRQVVNPLGVLLVVSLFALTASARSSRSRNERATASKRSRWLALSHGDDMVENQMTVVGTDDCFLTTIQGMRARFGLGRFIRNESTAHTKALFLIKVE